MVQVSCDVAELRKIAEVSIAETHCRNLLLDLQLQGFRKSSDPNAPFYKRETKAVATMVDEKMPDNVIFLVNTEKNYAIKGCIRLSSQIPQVIKQLVSVHVTAPDGVAVDLPVEVVTEAPDRCKFLAILQPDKLQSKKMTCTSPLCGTLDEKYIELDVRVVLLMGGVVQRLVPMKGTIYVQMHPPGRKFKARHLLRFVEGKWDYLPQPARDGARVAVSAAQALAPHPW